MEHIRTEGDCRQSPPDQLLQGIEEFNTGEYLECHETLEDIWISEPGVVRDLYQGILQVAVGLHHWREGNYEGAILLLRTGAQILRHVEPTCQGVDVALLIKETETVRKALETLGPDRMEELEQGVIPRVRFMKR